MKRYVEAAAVAALLLIGAWATMVATWLRRYDHTAFYE